MKQWITLLAFTAVLASCTKDNLQEETTNAMLATKAANMQAAARGSFVSDWETYSEWKKFDEGNVSIFSTVRKTPEVTSGVLNGGLVLVYARTETNDPAYEMFQEPRMMPFYFLPPSERPFPQTYYFISSASENAVTISYRAPYTKEINAPMGGGATLQTMQFQVIVISPDLLTENGLTPEQVRNNYTYQQVMNLLNS